MKGGKKFPEKTSEADDGFSARKIGWGGRIRTFTVLINSEVSYQLDHAPAASLAALPAPKPEIAKAHKQGRLRHVRRDEGSLLR